MTEKIYTDEVVVKKVGSFGSMMKGMMIGGLVGAGIALLSTPRTGHQTREMLREKSNELRDRASTTVDETRLRVEDFTREQKARATEIAQRSQEALQKQKAKVETAVESVKEGVKEGVRTYSEMNEAGSVEEGSISVSPMTGSPPDYNPAGPPPEPLPPL